MQSRCRPFVYLLAALSLQLVVGPSAWGQAATPAAASYDPIKTFGPLSLPDPVNLYRSGNGSPGPNYWQNEADYDLHPELDTAAKQLKATEVITYINNSSETLPSLWLHVEQNIYRKDSRSRLASGTAARGRRGGEEIGPRPSTEGYIFDSVEIESGKTTAKADYVIADTRMQIRLAEPLKPHSQLKIHIKYHYQIPGVWGGRTSWGKSEKGEIYDMAQWYPRMCVFDDLRGWDTLPYIGSEFYLEYGHFDYYVTVPSDMIVAGSGELMNPKEVLTKTELDRYEQAKNSDQTVLIRTPAEVLDPASRPKQGGTLTWHFHMDHTRDVAWSASPVFVWDAAKH